MDCSHAELAQDVWELLLQCKLWAKAQEACISLSVVDSLSYEKLKGAVLQAYELLPEAYQQHFRGLRKGQGQNYPDFEREKSLLSILHVK